MILTLDPALLQARVAVLEDHLRASPQDDAAWREFIALLDVVLRLGATLDAAAGKPLVLG